MAHQAHLVRRVHEGVEAHAHDVRGLRYRQLFVLVIFDVVAPIGTRFASDEDTAPPNSPGTPEPGSRPCPGVRPRDPFGQSRSRSEHLARSAEVVRSVNRISAIYVSWQANFTEKPKLDPIANRPGCPYARSQLLLFPGNSPARAFSQRFSRLPSDRSDPSSVRESCQQQAGKRDRPAITTTESGVLTRVLTRSWLADRHRPRLGTSSIGDPPTRSRRPRFASIGVRSVRFIHRELPYTLRDLSWRPCRATSARSPSRLRLRLAPRIYRHVPQKLSPNLNPNPQWIRYLESPTTMLLHA